MWKAGKQPCFTEEPWNTPLAEPVLQQLLGAVYRAEHTWKPLWFWKNTHEKLCTAWKCLYLCVSPAPQGVGGTKQMCKESPAEGHVGRSRGWPQSLHLGFICSASNAAFWCVILDKDLPDLVIFPKKFLLFSTPCGSHSSCHCLGSARLLALTLPAHH